MRTCNMAYCTLLSTVDYLPAVLVLNRSLKKVNSFFPLMVAVVEDIYDQVKDILLNEHCFLEKIKRLEYCEEVKQKAAGKTVLNTASKIQLFQLYDWEKLVYIDADCLVLQNIDDLFNWPDTSMIRYDEDNCGFTGLMVFSPAMHPYEFYEYLLTHVKCYDGDLLGKLWVQCKTNPAYQIPKLYLTSFNENLGKAHQYPSEWRDYKVIHFINNPKPWIKKPEAENMSWYMHQYLMELDKVIEQYNLSPLV